MQHGSGGIWLREDGKGEGRREGGGAREGAPAVRCELLQPYARP